MTSKLQPKTLNMSNLDGLFEDIVEHTMKIMDRKKPLKKITGLESKVKIDDVTEPDPAITTKDLIRELVMSGNIFTALELKSITIQDLAKYLKDSNVSDDAMHKVAYKALFIYSKGESCPDLEITRYEALRLALSGKADSKLSEIDTVIADKMPLLKALVGGHLRLLCFSRSNQLSAEWPLQVSTVVDCDWLERIPTTIEALKEIVFRVTWLQSDTRLQPYWDRLKPRYAALIKDFYKGHRELFKLLSAPQYLALTQYFPGILPSTTPVLVEMLKPLPVVLAAYYLGFPIHLTIPTKAQVDKACTMFLTKDLNYYDDVASYTNKLLQLCSPMQEVFGSDIKSIEIKSAMSGWSAFDLIDANGEIYHRGQFGDLLRTGIDPKTKKVLDSNVLEAIEHRIDLALKYSLPKAKPLRALVLDLYTQPTLIPKKD